MVPSFSSFFAQPEAEALRALHDLAVMPDGSMPRAQARARELIGQIRSVKRQAGQIESFLQEYSLSTEEGLALMGLAEALLRVPDHATAHALICDKVFAASWLERGGHARDWVVRAAGLGLFVSSKVLDGVFARLSGPMVREAMVAAMQMVGRQFVLGRDMAEAMKNARALEQKGYRLSYDILGEGARTREDAERYFQNYSAAIRTIGEAKARGTGASAGMSVKLSALHPRYSVFQAERCAGEMIESLRALCRLAAEHDIALTVDAEESERLDISIHIIEALARDSYLKGWEGFGLAVQAYHKAAPAVIRHMAGAAQEAGRRIQMRLVKGAYWDSEIKKAQVAGLDAFPVYTRKCHTDVSYLACAGLMLGAADTVFPMFATHNAYSVSCILEMANERRARFEFQRLFGMGQTLHDIILQRGDAPVSVYAPVGPHEDLLPYLVRRMLENGANSSFVNQVMSPDAPVEELVADFVDKSRSLAEAGHSKILLPKDLFLHEKPAGRANSAGMDLHAPAVRARLISALDRLEISSPVASIVGGRAIMEGQARDIASPADTSRVLGRAVWADADLSQRAVEVAHSAFPVWSARPAEERACILERAADLLEARRDDFMALLVREGGKVWPDALAEVREAIDFLRYYAAQGRALLAEYTLPGPTGESNVLQACGRGVFVCISPWNFPLAIFTGQVAAALMAGNSVLAKPAEQTPIVASWMVRLLHEAGVPVDVLNLLVGDGAVGAALCRHNDIGGVAFTGSTETARSINMALAARPGAIVPLIAETGGQNAMIVDSTALPEQVVDDVIVSAFGSAGQRCSALRVLCLQEECADRILHLLQGAMAELRLGAPEDFSSDVGPIIDAEAREGLLRHREKMAEQARLVYEVQAGSDLVQNGFFFAPCVYEIEAISQLEREVFGPILHVVRYRRGELERLLSELRATGYGLTLGVQSRIGAFQEHIVSKMRVGNIYVNRSMIGAVVGSQPFGGMGLSGTGPKAGGPHYLMRFAGEKTVCVNTAAAGGNASLVSLGE